MKRHLFCVLATLTLFVSPAFAATYVWNGAVSDRFSDAANWSGGSPATDPQAELAFPAAAARKTVTNDLPNLTVHAISFTASGYTINGLPIRLTDATVGDTTQGPTAISCELILRGTTTVVTMSDVYEHPGLTLSGPITGSGGLVKAGTGRVTLSGTTSNSYSGTTNVARGELRLAKNDGVTAIRGPFVIDGVSGGEAEVLAAGLEQIANDAPVTVGRFGTLRLPRSETLGALTVERGAEIRMTADRSGTIRFTGSLILGGDVRLVATPGANSQATIVGGTFIPATRTITIDPDAAHALWIPNVGTFALDANLILRRGPGTGTARVEIGGSYGNPTIVDGPSVSLENPNTDVTVRSGTFGGEVKSLTAEGGTIGSSEVTGTVRLGPSATVALAASNGGLPAMTAGGLVLGNATLRFTFSSLTHAPGTTYVLIANSGSIPIEGTFAGMPEGTILENRFRLSYAGGTGNDVTLTDITKYFSKTTLTVEGSAVRGATLQLRADVSSDRSSKPETGTVTFRIGDTVIATVPLDGIARAVTTYVPTAAGSYTITARYESDATIEPSVASQVVTISPPTATLTSVEPAAVQAGETVSLILRGTDFREDSLIVIDSVGFQPQSYTPSELRGTWTVPQRTGTSVVQVRVSSESRGTNSLPITITGPPATPSVLTFDERAIRGPVGPGGSTAWIRGAVRRGNEIEQAIVRDTDNDGTVIWNLAEAVTTNTIAVMVDMQSGTIHAGNADEIVPAPRPFPATFLRDPSGAYSYIVLIGSSFHGMLWVRPSTGAWRLNIAPGATHDLDPTPDRIITNTSFMLPIGDSPAAPSGFARGDVLAGVLPADGVWYGAKVDDYLKSGPGTLSVFPAWSDDEDFETAKVTIVRTGGTDGAITVNYATADGTAIAGVHYRAVAGTVTFGPGEIVKTIEIPLIDDTTFGADLTFKVLLTDPAGTTITGPAETAVRIDEDDKPPRLDLGPDTRVDEGDGGVREVTMLATLTGASRVPIQARWSASVDSRQTGSGTLFFAPGETTKTISTTFSADTVSEPDSRITFTINTDSDADFDPVIGRRLATVTVVDDDPLPRLTLLDAGATENGPAPRVRIIVSGETSRPILVTYMTVSGTAVAGSDFTAKTASAIGGFIEVPLINDSVAETPESFSVVVTHVENATLVRSSALVTIADDDTAPVPAISIAGPSVPEGDGGTVPAAFTVQLTAASQSRVTVNWLTSDGTAVAGDYTAASGTVTFEPGETVKTIAVNVLGDTASEGDETFMVRLSSPSNATLRNAEAIAVIRNDDVSRHRGVRP